MLARLLTIGLLSGLLFAPSPRAEEGAVAADAFFAATLEDTSHRPVALEGMRGKPVLVNFWATWCVPCRAEIPALIDAYESRKDQGLAVVGVAMDDDVAAVRDFASATAMTYLVLTGQDRAMALIRELGGNRTAVPLTVAIDRSGKVVAKKFGILRPGDLTRMLDALLGAGGSEKVALRP